MDIRGIIYQSASGHAERYAKIISECLDVPSYDLFRAMRQLRKNDEVIFIGWIRNRDLMGYGLMLRRYDVRAVCAVGAVDEDNSHYALDRIERRYHISEKAPLFYLRGGFDQMKTRGSDRRIVNYLKDDLAKKISKSRKYSIPADPYDQALWQALMRGGDYVSRDNLTDLLRWYKNSSAC